MRLNAPHHIRRGRSGKKVRQQRALDRWIANRDRGYTYPPGNGHASGTSHPVYVDDQIFKLETKTV